MILSDIPSYDRLWNAINIIEIIIIVKSLSQTPSYINFIIQLLQISGTKHETNHLS